MSCKTCMNCEYRHGGIDYGRCLRTATYISITREYRSGICDSKFSGWAPKRSTLRRLIDWVTSFVWTPKC